MIASLTGVLQHKALDRIVIDVGGVGYLVWLSTQTLADLPPQGQPVALLCHTHVREDALTLFGFGSEQERRAFELLISVSGIGPRLALVILSGMPVAALVRAVADGQHARLQSIPGIGRKTAERLVVELRERFAAFEGDLAVRTAADGTTARGDVIEALVNLGYKRPLAERAAQRAVQQHAEAEGSVLPAEQLLREALALIGDV